MVNGGADIARQYLEAGAIDELRLHLVPVFLGGTRLLGESSPPNVRLAAHPTYDVKRAATQKA